jgi:ornithine cyclodeaminase/alanine dehydrogenase-like protein (mu-crystallin family)
MSVRLISRTQITEILSMGKAIELMGHAFAAHAAGQVLMPPRQRVETAEGDMLLKPAYLPGEGFCVKLVMTYPGNQARGLPVVQGLMLVFDDATGTPRALIDAAELTAIRTGAAGGLAIKLLARRDCRSVVLIGAGVQGRKQLAAAMAVRSINQVFLFEPNNNVAEGLIEDLRTSTTGLRITRIDDPDDGVAQADIVLTATTSPIPTFNGSALRPGTHINAVGAYQPDRRELDERTMRQAYVVVDGWQAAGIEAGELAIPGITADAELGEVLNGSKPGRLDDRQVTVFKSVGMAVQDAFSATFVVREAERLGIGMEVDLA